MTAVRIILPRIISRAFEGIIGEADRLIIELERVLNYLVAPPDWKDVANDSTAGYQDTWGDDATYPVGWYKNADQIVYLVGEAERTTGGMAIPSTIFTLPQGFRPGRAMRFTSEFGSNVTDINTNGDVILQTGSSVAGSNNMSGIHFNAEN